MTFMTLPPRGSCGCAAALASSMAESSTAVSQDVDTWVVSRSLDARDPAGPPTFDGVIVDMGGSLGFFASGPNPGGLSGQVWVAVDHSSGPRRGHVYLPNVDEKAVAESAVSELLDRLFDGSRARLVNALLGDGELSRPEFEQLRREILALREAEERDDE